MITIEQAQDNAAREWHPDFDYRSIRNGVQVGNIQMLHLDKVNKRAMQIYSMATWYEAGAAYLRNVESKFKYQSNQNIVFRSGTIDYPLINESIAS